MTAERIRLRDAVLIAGVPKRTLQDLAASGAIPGAGKPSGRWTFDVRQLRAWAGRVKKKDKPCRISINVAKSGGRGSRCAASNTDDRYLRALGLSRNDA